MSDVASLLVDLAMNLLDANGSPDADLSLIELQLHELAQQVEPIDPRCAIALQKSANLLKEDPSAHLHLKDDPLLIALKTVAAVQLIVREESTWEESGIPNLLSEDFDKTRDLPRKLRNPIDFRRVAKDTKLNIRSPERS
jgi:hypothetical protein